METPSLATLRQSVFDALRSCTQTYVNGDDSEIAATTRRLLSAIAVFYNSNPNDDELITLENAAHDEIEVVSDFMGIFPARTRFPIHIDSNFSLQELSDITTALAALRIQFFPQLGDRTHPNFFPLLFRLSQMEDNIREELNRRERPNRPLQQSHASLINSSTRLPNRQCIVCLARTTVLWRQISGHYACNSCGQYCKLNGGWEGSGELTEQLRMEYVLID